jgi:DNA invertase Pin-like site-specific DNA recombinase
MTKITAEHLSRSAIVYVRQSTFYQVMNNLESGRRQYGLVERARQLGWSDVQVIDEDLGKSGGGTTRAGFERLLTAICERNVGVVLSLEASRLARNGRDWHTLLEFCGLVGTLIVDEDGIYDPRLPNDRLLLGMKGTMSEMEVSVFRQRSIEAIKQKARRGEHFSTVGVGYVKCDGDRIEKDPDRRVRDAIALIFRRFAELQTIRQVLVWIRQEQILLPALQQGPGKQPILWKTPVYHTLHHILTNPVYAGAYAFGRRGTTVALVEGRKRMIRSSIRRKADSWEVLIKDHHEGYISWEEFVRNQEIISDNANGKSYLGRGSVRRGEALLPGLFRCGRCGRKLTVHYGSRGKHAQSYSCRGAFSERAEMSCISFGGMRVDCVVAQEVLERVQPLGIEAALTAMKNLEREHSEKRLQLENALGQARFEAARAYRQYDASDPENRLVTAELERRWNERLLAVRRLEEEISRLDSDRKPVLAPVDRERLLLLGEDLARAWNNPEVTHETRKKIVRLLIAEIVVDVTESTVSLIIHWQGGDHTCLTVKKNRAGQTRWSNDDDVISLIEALARQMPDKSIAAVLNRSGKQTGHGNTWTRMRVCDVRKQKGIAIYKEGERKARGEVTLNEAADILAVSPSTVRRMIGIGLLPAKQLCKGAPWIIQEKALHTEQVNREANCRRARIPSSHDLRQRTLDL